MHNGLRFSYPPAHLDLRQRAYAILYCSCELQSIHCCCSVPPMAVSIHSFLPLHFSPTISNRRIVLYNASFAPRKAPVTRCARRTGKRRYPSEKRKLEEIKKNLLTTEIWNREEGYWRISKLSVPAHKDPGKDFVGFSLPLLEAIAKVLEFPVSYIH